MPDYLARLTKLETQIGLPGCTCAGRQNQFVVLNYMGGTPEAELLEQERQCRWQCPAHGSCSVAHLLTIHRSRRASSPVGLKPG